MKSPMFDGHDLGLIGICGDPKITVFDSDVAYQDSPAMRGTHVLARRWAKSELSFTLCVEGQASERRDKLSTLASWLDVDEPCKLVLPDTPDRYYLAVPSGPLELSRYIGAEVGQLTFVLTDPASYGTTKTVTVPSGGSVSFILGGTCPTKPIITADAVRDVSSSYYSLLLDNADYLHVPTGLDVSVALSIDCEGRTCTLDGDVGQVTLDSDWFELSPGEHTITNNLGTGAATVTFAERWY